MPRKLPESAIFEESNNIYCSDEPAIEHENKSQIEKIHPRLNVGGRLRCARHLHSSTCGILASGRGTRPNGARDGRTFVFRSEGHRKTDQAKPVHHWTDGLDGEQRNGRYFDNGFRAARTRKAFRMGARGSGTLAGLLSNISSSP